MLHGAGTTEKAFVESKRLLLSTQPLLCAKEAEGAQQNLHPHATRQEGRHSNLYLKKANLESKIDQHATAVAPFSPRSDLFQVSRGF